MKNEDKIRMVISTLSKDIVNKGGKGVTAQDISEVLGIKRNVISHFLNKMVDEGTVIKTKTRPVYFLYKEVADSLNTNKLDLEEDVFKKLIGSNGSLAEAVEECKSATLYPNNGLPILLTGSSGVGKSFMAKLIYEYAKSKKVIKEDAKLITFNCAEYSNNKELLSSKLFGYVKGAFTGADIDSKGIIEEAENGYLFLDEIHRLSPEGQEKLFLLLDKGIFNRIGENGSVRKSNVRLIFATTEKLDEFLIDTFIRRIPIIINLPNINCRPIDERIELIKRFYKEERDILGKNIIIDEKVINILLAMNSIGNVGALKNAVKYSCASSFMKNIYGDVIVEVKHLPKNIVNIKEVKSIYNLKNMYITEGDNTVDEVSKFEAEKTYNKYIGYMDEIYEETEKYEENLISSEEYKKILSVKLNKIDSIFIEESGNLDNSTGFNVLINTIEIALKDLENKYGMKFYKNTARAIGNIFIFFKNNKNANNMGIVSIEESILKIIKTKNFKYNYIAKKFLENIEESIGVSFGINEETYISLYIFLLIKINHLSDIDAFIVAHGQSTATSIASAVNQLLGQFIFKAFDMPIYMKPQEIIEDIKSYIKNFTNSSGIIFLVDMGSLFEIHSGVKEIVDSEVAVINNISTQLALGVGDMIINGDGIKEIIDKTVKNTKISYKYFESKEKEKAIITSCATGIGVANKIKDIVKGCIDDKSIKVISYDFFKLKNNGISDPIFDEYDVQLIISTLDLTISGIEVLKLSDCLKNEGEAKLRACFKKIVKNKSIDVIINELIKLLSLQNIISRMIILNPKKVIDDVERIINILENQLEIKLNRDLRLSLFIHTAIMIERVVLDKNSKIEDNTIPVKYDKNQFEILKNILENELKDYSISIPENEIALMLGIINFKYS